MSYVVCLALFLAYFCIVCILSGCVVCCMSWLPYGVINDDN